MLLHFQRTADTGSPKLFQTRKRGSPTAFHRAVAAAGLVVSKISRAERPHIRQRTRLAHQATATARSGQNASPVAGLARFFPDATSMRMPVQLARVIEAGSPADFSESTVIEFGTPREVLFASKTPLEFADILRVRNSDGSLDEEVSVVAVQYQPGKTLVAARFRRNVPNWIVKS